MKLIAPSILSADFSRLGEEIRDVEAAGADWIHVDVMDGHFVPNITIGPVVVIALKKATRLPLDVHLMIEHPEHFIESFLKAGADIISIHLEANQDHLATLKQIRQGGAKASLAINPETGLEKIAPLMDGVDMILVMTVNPGFGGQEFIATAQEKIAPLRKMIGKRKICIEVDGGVKLDNIQNLSRLGADIFVSGSGIFKTGDYKKTISEMKHKVSS